MKETVETQLARMKGQETVQGINRRYKDVTHPEYNALSLNWIRWRLCYLGGRPFVWQFLERFAREGQNEFIRRRNMTPSPSFAKAALNEIANAVFQRLSDVERLGGSDTYRRAMRGELGGVDLKAASMSAFLGRYVIPELLIQGRVGIWIDNESLPASPTLAQVGNVHPYLYAYRAEDIRNWVYLEGPRQGDFQSVLLCDSNYQLDDNTQLPTTKVENYRHAYIDPDDGYVHVVTEDFAGTRNEQVLKMRKLPFVMLELPQSLMKDIDGHQIALLNLLSADVSYATKSNYPFYIEQYDHRTGNVYSKPSQPSPNRVPNTLVPGAKPPPGTSVSADGQNINIPTGSVQSAQSKQDEIVTGVGVGRRYAKDLVAPAFIHPSSEPLKASMELREQLKTEIREMVMLDVMSLSQQSAESKQQDWRSLENGLSFIGLVLEQGERQVAERWALYENSAQATIQYPEVWSLLSDKDRRLEAEELKKHLDTVASPTFRSELVKRIVKLLIGHFVPMDVVDKIFKEIDEVSAICNGTETIIQHVENGLVSAELASKLCGYPAGEVAKAALEHAARIARIAAAQGELGAPNAPDRTKGEGVGGLQPGDAQARGVKDLSADPSAAAKERKNEKDKTTKGSLNDNATRGKGD